MPYKGQLKLCIEFTKQEPGSHIAWRPCRKSPLQSFLLNQIQFDTIRHVREKEVATKPDFNINKANNQMVFFRGLYGAKYAIGYEGRIRRPTDELHVNTRAFNH